ncbi:hypothetical protein ACU8DI_00160 [Psychroserpens sp. BH13MA-6]
MYYYLIVAFQAFCIYHWFKNKNDYYWVFLILFLPLLGCIIYLITQVYNKRDVDKLQEEFTTIINPSKKIKDLENTLAFSETFQNRVNLADALYENKDFENAIKHYDIAISKDFQNDTYVGFQLIKSYFFLNQYDKVIAIAKKFEDHREFQGSKVQFFYGLSLAKSGNIKLAETHLRAIDQRYSNYEERLVYAQFLLEQDQTDQAKSILNAINDESQHMTAVNKRKYKQTIRQVQHLLNSL